MIGFDPFPETWVLTRRWELQTLFQAAFGRQLDAGTTAGAWSNRMTWDGWLVGFPDLRPFLKKKLAARGHCIWSTPGPWHWWPWRSRKVACVKNSWPAAHSDPATPGTTGNKWVLVHVPIKHHPTSVKCPLTKMHLDSTWNFEVVCFTIFSSDQTGLPQPCGTSPSRFPQTTPQTRCSPLISAEKALEPGACCWISIHIQIYVYIYIYIYIFIFTYIHTYVRTYITLHYIALHCITLHYISLHTLYYITLHYIRLD